MMRQKVSLISLKLGTLEVQNGKNFTSFGISHFAQKLWKKFRFMFENQKLKKKNSKDFPVKNETWLI